MNLDETQVARPSQNDLLHEMDFARGPYFKPSQSDGPAFQVQVHSSDAGSMYA